MIVQGVSVQEASAATDHLERELSSDNFETSVS